MAITEELIACICLGIACEILGIWMIMNKSWKYIHPKYLKDVSEANKSNLAVSCGIGISLTGIGLLMLAPTILYDITYLSFLGSACFISGLFIAVFSIYYFGGEFF